MYLFYVDESGQREYGEGTTRYFVLCGVGIPSTSWRSLNDNINALKKLYFGDPTVELKSKWLRIPSARTKHYVRPYASKETDLQELVAKLYDLIEESDMVLFAAVIDKIQMQEQYSTPQSPSSLAYKFIFERFQQFLQGLHQTEQGIVIFDKISEAQFVKRGYENLLSRQHLRYLEKGTDYVRIDRIIEGLLFIPSYENNFIQIADLCAYNTFRQFRQFGEDWDTPGRGQVRSYPYFERIARKFYMGPRGRLSGYGVKKYPDRGKVLWFYHDE